MATPAINTTQSVLGFLQWQPFEFQPYASYTPTSWSSSPLPPGVTINGATGKISGAATKPGVYNVALRATNGDGTSPAIVFTFGIEASSPTAGADIDLTFDLISRRIRLTRPAPLAGAIDATAATPADPTVLDKSATFCTAKEEDDMVFRLRFEKGGVVVDPAITAIKFSLKELEPDAILLESVDGDWIRDGTGANATFRVYAKLTGNLLKAALSDYEEDDATEFLALAEFKVVFTNPDHGSFGPSTMRRTAAGLMLIQRQQEA